MNDRSAPRRPRVLSIAIGGLGLAVAWIGLAAYGYLFPAAVALACAGLLWLGRGRRIVTALAWINLVSAALLIFALASGELLGAHKLDLSGVSLLANLATGGPALGLVAPALLLGLRRGAALDLWFARR